MSYVPHSDVDRRAMLAAIGVSSVRELFSDIPAAIVRDGPLELP